MFGSVGGEGVGFDLADLATDTLEITVIHAHRLVAPRNNILDVRALASEVSAILSRAHD